MWGWAKLVNRSEYISSEIRASFQKTWGKFLNIARSGNRRHRFNGVGALLVAIQVLRNSVGKNLQLFLWEVL